MHFYTACLVLLFTSGFGCAGKQCRMPSGNAGECMFWKDCKPLFKFNKKRVKSETELLYWRQSSCGISTSYNLQYCCPPKLQWSNFQVNPAMYNEITIYDDPIVTKEEPHKNNIDNDNGNDIVPQETIDVDKIDAVDKINVSTLGTKGPIEIAQNIEFECGKDMPNRNRIIGGGPAAIDQYPWLVLLEYDKGLTLCGGSLITTRYVLTAAHCIKRVSQPKFARLAEYNTSSYPTDYVAVDGGGFDYITVEIVEIEKNIAHPNYTREYLHHDIGLSKLKQVATLTDFIRLICLPTYDFIKSFKSPLNFTVAGWGSEGIRFSEVKKHVKVPYVTNDKCQAVYSLRTITNGQICAGGEVNEDSCSGDSGGPLMYDFDNKFIAIGIVSLGTSRCGTKDVPGVHTYVYPYLGWIRDNMD